jgi:hypothetical protein
MKKLFASLGAALVGLAFGVATPTPASASCDPSTQSCGCWRQTECWGHQLVSYTCCETSDGFDCGCLEWEDASCDC